MAHEPNGFLPNGFLIDTHVWLWLLLGEKKLKESKSFKILSECGHKSLLKVSCISVWEVGMLEKKGRIKLPASCLDWITQALTAPGVSLTELSPDIAIEASRLPGSFHGDPADRIIVATARKLGFTLVTEDSQILHYGNQGFVHVEKALT